MSIAESADRERGHAFTALKNSFKDCCDGISQGSDLIADIIVDDDKEENRTKGRRIRDESVNILKSVASNIKRDMAGISLKAVVCDASYGAGKVTGIARNALHRLYLEVCEN